VLVVLDAADPAYAARVRSSLLPLYDYLPTDRSGLAWQAPALQAYLALDDAVRHELTARVGELTERVGELTERVAAMRVTYADRVGDEAASVAVRCAATARHGDAFHAAMTAGRERTYRGANVRDLAMAENVEWILGREERIVVAAANGHVQRWPFRVPPFVPEPMTVLGEHLAAALGERMVVIGSTYGGGTMWLHRSVPGAAPGHTEAFIEDIGPFDDTRALDVLLAGTGVPLGLLDLRRVPVAGPVAERFAALEGVMNGPHLQPLDPRAAFDAVVHVDRVTPWHTVLDVGRASRGASGQRPD
jgi:erythromycin esterase